MGGGKAGHVGECADHREAPGSHGGPQAAKGRSGQRAPPGNRRSAPRVALVLDNSHARKLKARHNRVSPEVTGSERPPARGWSRTVTPGAGVSVRLPVTCRKHLHGESPHLVPSTLHPTALRNTPENSLYCGYVCTSFLLVFFLLFFCLFVCLHKF